MLRQILIEISNLQSPTPIQTDNTTAHEIIINTVKRHHTRAIDMNFYWLRDQGLQQKYHFYWREGKKLCGLLFQAPSRHPPSEYETLYHQCK